MYIHIHMRREQVRGGGGGTGTRSPGEPVGQCAVPHGANKYGMRHVCPVHVRGVPRSVVGAASRSARHCSRVEGATPKKTIQCAALGGSKAPPRVIQLEVLTNQPSHPLPARFVHASATRRAGWTQRRAIKPAATRLAPSHTRSARTPAAECRAGRPSPARCRLRALPTRRCLSGGR